MIINQKDTSVYAYMLKKNLLLFTRFFFKHIHGDKFIMNWHHIELFNGLTEVYNRIIDILIENLPPRHSKTEIIIMFIAWSLANNKASSFLVISSDDTLANELSRKVREIILHPIYKQLFDVELKQDVNSKGLWRTKENGGIRSVPIGGGITGFGAGHINDFDKFYGGIILDDPDKIANIGTANETLASERFDDTIISRRNGTNTPIIVIQQRISENDLTGHILSNESKLGNVDDLRFKHICIPVLKDNMPIWEKRFNMQQIEAARADSDTAFIFDAQYMQDPSTKAGKIFSQVKYFQMDMLDMSKIEEKIILADPADEGKDYYCAPVACLIGKEVYIIDVMYNQLLLSQNKDVFSKFIDKHRPDNVFIEVNREGTAYISYFVDQCKENNIRLVPVKQPTNQSKLIRILNEEIHIKECFYFRNDDKTSYEYRKFLSDFKRFNSNMKNKNDDGPDAIASISKYFRILKRQNEN